MDFNIDKCEEGKKTKQARQKRAGGRCEPVGALRCTGPGAFCLNRAERMRPVTGAAPYKKGS